MFQKVRIRLTLLCSGIITLLIIIMSFLYLRISENSLYRNQFYSFQNDSNTIIINLEQQSVITMECLSKRRPRETISFICWITDIPFFIIHCMIRLLQKTGLLLHQMAILLCPKARHLLLFLTSLKRRGRIMKARCPRILLWKRHPLCLPIRHGTGPFPSQIPGKMITSAH